MYQAADSAQECGERQYRASSVSESNGILAAEPRISRRNSFLQAVLSATALKTVNERCVRCNTGSEMFDKNKSNKRVSMKEYKNIYFRIFVNFYFSK